MVPLVGWSMAVAVAYVLLPSLNRRLTWGIVVWSGFLLNAVWGLWWPTDCWSVLRERRLPVPIFASFASVPRPSFATVVILGLALFRYLLALALQVPLGSLLMLIRHADVEYFVDR